MAKLQSLFDVTTEPARDVSLIAKAAGSMSLTGVPEYVSDTLTRMLQEQYFEYMDRALYDKYGERDARYTTQLEAVFNIQYYLFAHAKEFEKCLGYIDAEYNPVENYSGSEQETTTFEGGARRTDHSETFAQDHTKTAHGQELHTENYAQKQDTDLVGSAQDTFGYGQDTNTNTYNRDGYTETMHTAKTRTEETPTVMTHVTKKAPFESDTFHNESEQIDTPLGSNVTTVERIAAGSDGGNDSKEYSSKVDVLQRAARSDTVTHGQHTDTHTSGAHIDTFTDAAHDVDVTRDGRTDTGYDSAAAYTDTNTRRLTRHGNLGVMTAGEMMRKDFFEFWHVFAWLDDAVHDLANLLSSGVVGL